MATAFPRHRTPRVLWVFFVLVALVFTCVYPFLPSVNNPNENVRTYMTMALVEDHTFRIDKIVDRYGWVNDMAAVPEKDGSRHLFSVKAPAVSYAGVPFYWLMTKLAPHAGMRVATDESSPEARQSWFLATTFVLRLFTIQLPCFLFLVWLERWLRETSPDVALRLCAVAAAGLGTNYLAYSLMFASHAPFAIAAFCSFAITTSERARHPLDPKKRRLSRAFLAGFYAGLATLLEYHAGLVSACLGIYALITFWRPTRYAMFGLGAGVNAAALLYFQWRCFKNPFMPGHRMSENQLYAHLLSQGWFGIGKPDPAVFKSISFNLGYGFFGTSPFMWLGFLAIPYAVIVGFGPEREQRQRRLATLGWMFTMFVLWGTVSAAINWRGGWTVGPRYLGAAPPFFAYGALCAFEAMAGHSKVRRSILRGIAGGAAVASILTIGVVGMHFNTIPEDISRPLVQLTWPMALAGFVPHHALELFGITSPVFWYFLAACAVGAGVVGAFAPSGTATKDRLWAWGLRGAVFAGTFVLAMLPALSTPSPEERRDLGEHSRHSFTAMWHPQGRDRIKTLREEAETYGDRRPCNWVRLAHLETLVGMRAEAARDEAKAMTTPVAGQPAVPPQCHAFADRLDKLLTPPEPKPSVPGAAPPSERAVFRR